MNIKLLVMSLVLFTSIWGLLASENESDSINANKVRKKRQFGDIVGLSLLAIMVQGGLHHYLLPKNTNPASPPDTKLLPKIEPSRIMSVLNRAQAKFLKKHMVRYDKYDGSTRAVELCYPETRRKRMTINDFQNMDEIIYDYTQLADHSLLGFEGATIPANTPYTRIIHQRVTGNVGQREILVPHVILAEIRHNHLNRGRPGPPAEVDAHMQEMGGTEDDDRGHLLAASLGGTWDTFNIVPMARSMNRNESPGIYGDLYNRQDMHGTSYWRANEDYIRNFLRANPTGMVNWRIVVNYHPNLESYRPIGFCHQFTTINGTNHTTFHSNQICYSNDPRDACGYSVGEIDEDSNR